MKFTKPSYNAKDQVYISLIQSGICIERFFDSTPKEISLTSEELNIIIPVILDGTKGWFSKPILQDWLEPRIAVDIPAFDLGSDFEGNAKWQLTSLKIFKQSVKQNFVLYFTLVEKVKEDKVCIAFDEEEQELQKEESIEKEGGSAEAPLTKGRGAEAPLTKERGAEAPLTKERGAEAPLTKGRGAEAPLTRRQQTKEMVLKARNRAARALFKAERLTQDYIASYGENTDWEDSDLDSVS